MKFDYKNWFRLFNILIMVIVPGLSQAQQTVGTLIIVPAYGEVKTFNDQARALLAVEEQNSEKAEAVTRVNKKMKIVQEMIKQIDPKILMQTRGYHTYAIYSEEQTGKKRERISWRVMQTIEIITTNLEQLPKVIAIAQAYVSLSNIQFELSKEAEKKLDAQCLQNAYHHLQERIGVIAQAMGKRIEDATIESIDFEGNGMLQQPESTSVLRAKAMAMTADSKIEEPSFEAGETTLNIRILARVKFH